MEESILRDIINTAKSVSTDVGDVLRHGRSRKVSLSRGAKKGVMQFPMIVPKSATLEDVTRAGKAVERKYVSFVQVVTSLGSTTNEKDIEGYLKSLHQNFDITDTSTIGTAGAFYNGFSKAMTDVSEMTTFKNLHTMNEDVVDKIFEDHSKYMINISETSAAERSLVYNEAVKIYGKDSVISCNEGIFISEGSEYKEIVVVGNTDSDLVNICESIAVPKGFTYSTTEVNVAEELITESLELANEDAVYPFVESILNDIGGRSELVSLSEKKNNRSGKRKGPAAPPKPAAPQKPTNTPQKPTNTPQKPTTTTNVVKNRKFIKSVASDKTTSSSRSSDHDEPEYFNSVTELKDSDTKKANELVPTMMKLTTHFTDKDGKVKRTAEYLIGVKVTIHAVSSESMVENLVKGLKKERMFQKIIKYTTGEISFFKDLLFAIDEIKDEVKGKYKGDSMWWSALSRRKEKARFLNRIGRKDMLPNATILITNSELETIRSEYKIDLEDPKVAQALMKSQFLLGFVILDPSTETAKFFFDGEVSYEQYSYNSLEREQGQDKKDIKNIMAIMGKM